MLLGLLLVVFVLSLYGVRLVVDGFHDDYLAKKKTDSIKGIFILLVFLSHSLRYVSKSGYPFAGLGDSAYCSFFAVLTQLTVVMFLFYSGYGVYESFKKKGWDYVKQMPRRRLLTTLLNFDVAVVIYALLCLALGITITLKDGLIALTAWQCIGLDQWGIFFMDNWYIFVILLCYLATYIVLRSQSRKRLFHVVGIFALCLSGVVALAQSRGNFWYNTLLCFPLGVLYSAYKEPIEAFLKRYYWAALAVSVTLLAAIFALFSTVALPNLYQLPNNIFCMVFAMVVVITTMKFGIGNPVLHWLGGHLFPIFIYMRLPMIFMEYQSPSIISTYPLLFILISLAVTLIIAYFYKHCEIRLD